MQRKASRTSLLAAETAVTLEKPTEETAVVENGKCMMQYVQSAVLKPKFPLFPEMTDQSIAAIAIRTTGKLIA